MAVRACGIASTCGASESEGRTGPAASGSSAGSAGLYRCRLLLPVFVTLGVVLAALLFLAAAVSLLIGWVVRSAAPLRGFVALMFAVAVWTAGRRITGNRTWRWAAVPIGAGVLPVVGALLLTGLVPVRGVALYRWRASSSAGRSPRPSSAGGAPWANSPPGAGEVEAGLALGLLDRDARLEIVRPTASDALLPGLDQTRTVGLVTLPGAFVGMLLGGASPVEAGAVQLFVLVALMAVQGVAVATVLELVARGLLYRD